MLNTSIRKWALAVGVVSLIGLCFAVVPPIAQDPRYHSFADRRTLHGIRNYWNVVSNVPFLLAALYGVRVLWRPHAFISRSERVAYGLLLIASAAVGLGSAYYHLHPDDAGLFWDRLPMAVLFMALVAAVAGRRFGPETGRRLLIPLLLLGAGSVLIWRATGDLRLYAVVQFGSLLTVPLLLRLFPARYSGDRWIWGAVVLYALAKALELLDHNLASAIAMGGHPWKHLAAAAAILFCLKGLADRRPLPKPAVDTRFPEPLVGAPREAIQ